MAKQTLDRVTFIAKGFDRVPPRARTVAALAVDVADAVAALDEAALPTSVRSRLQAILDRANAVHTGVPVSAAASLLDVTTPTVKAWIDRGVLDIVPGTPRQVTTASLGEAIAAVEQIRSLGGDGRLLARTIEAIEDRRLRRELEGRLSELDDREEFDPDDATSIFG